MPRNVRNFWIEANIDGRQSNLSGGPQNKDGGFRLSIQIRDDGDILDALHISGYRDGNALILTVRPQDDVAGRVEAFEDGINRDSFSFKIKTNR